MKFSSKMRVLGCLAGLFAAASTAWGMSPGCGFPVGTECGCTTSRGALGGGCPTCGACPTCGGRGLAACGCGAGRGECGGLPAGALGSRIRAYGSGADRTFGGGQGCGPGGNVLSGLSSTFGGIGLAGCNSCGSGNCSGAVYHCGVAAPPYPVPFATPRPTTWTEFTYPPMMPHNSLPHYRGTYSYRHAPGLSRTNVMWYPTKVQNAFDRVHNIFEIPR